MTITATLPGETSGDGFLITPLDGQTFPAELTLRTDAGTATVTLRAAPDDGRLVFSQPSCELTTEPTVVTVHATAVSQTRQDTAVEVVDDAGDVAARLEVTCIGSPVVVHFRGRFEARFATQNAIYNANPAYTADPTEDENVINAPGWTWILEGEPPFVPATDNIPERIETPVGRQVRFNDPVALRSHAEPVVSVIDTISGQIAAGEVTFTGGDPLIGEPVNLGPNTYFAGNREQDPADPRPEEFYRDAEEPLGLFELHLGERFSGASAVGPFTHKATAINEHTRTPDSRPVASGIVAALDDLAQFGLPPDVRTVSATRIDALVTDFVDLPAGDSTERRNLRRRIGHLLSTVTPQKRNAVLAANPGEFDVRPGTLRGGWPNKEVYLGKVDADLQVRPDGSSVVDYLSRFTSFSFESHMFAFHSDELCAYHIGSLTPEV